MLKNTYLLLLLLLLSKNVFANTDTIPKRYLIIFSARDASLYPFSIGGHAFTTWATQTSPDTIILELTLGFYPNANASLLEKIFEYKHGHLGSGYNNNSNQMELEEMVIEVDSTTWCNSQDVKINWQRKQYNLLRSNCVMFLNAVAKKTNLHRTKTMRCHFLPIKPIRYLRKLQRKNKDRIVILNPVCVIEK